MEQKTILVVDDTPENLDILSGVLRPEFRVKAALNGERALAIVQKLPAPDMILLDVMMPGLDGYAVCKRLKEDPATAPIPVIFITAKGEEEDEKQGLELGAVDYITKPFRPAIVLARVRTHLALYDQNLMLEQKVYLRTEELERTRLEIIRRLGRAAEYRDNETGLHVIRMSHYAHLIAAALDRGTEWSNLIFHSAAMHDIGKIGIPDSILLKPGKLDAKEWDLMRKHSEMGASIIGEHTSMLLRMAAEIAMAHHEKFDGSGYPFGLKGDQIPLTGRIVAVADVFDALTTVRPYKAAWSVAEAIEYLDDNSGTHFDPQLIQVFHEVLPEILEIKETYAEPE